MKIACWLVSAMTLSPGHAATAVSATPAERTSRVLSVDDVFRVHDLADPRISPDGRWVAYTDTVADSASDRPRTRLWMVPVAGGEAIPLTSPGRSAWSPRWSPDGLKLAFLAEDVGGRTQVWTLYRHGGEAAQVTEIPQGVEDYSWSPDGRRLVLVLTDVDPSEAPARGAQGSTAGRQRPWVIDRLQFKADGVGYLDNRRRHLYVLDLGGGSPVQVTSGAFDDSSPSWSPSGRSIAFVSNRTENPDGNYNTDLWVVDPESPQSVAAPRRLTRNPGPDTAPAWSPDGRLVVYVSAVNVAAMEYATRHLAIVPVGDEAGDERLVEPRLDRNVESPRFSGDGHGIVFVLEDRGERNLARIPVAGGPLERIITGRQTVDAFDVAPRGGVVALLTEPRFPGELFLHDGEILRRLTHANDEWLAGLRLGDVEKIRFKSADGTAVEGFVVRPPDMLAGERGPAVLWVHGGPQSQYDWRFDFRAQLLAANGYVVVLPNPRGSTGYGEAFCLGVWQGWGAKDYPDFVAAVDHAVKLGYADPERLGVGGWSYGGYATNGIVTRTNRFKAAISGASAVLYAANYGHDQWQRWWELEWGLPWRNRALWERHSPFNEIEKIRTPTLVMGAEEDWNVPVQNSEQLYLALRRLGRTTQLVVYPGESHTLTRPSFVKDRYERYLAWFGRYLRNQR